MNPTTTPKSVKPQKPSANFPLFAHATRRWAKKVKGKMYYFGPWEDPDALANWERQQSALLSGYKPVTVVRTVVAKRGDRPAKPYASFPLFAHATGRWAKKVRGQLKYFGPWNDPVGAEAKWHEQEDDLRAGRKPHAANGEITVRDAVNAFLTSKDLAMREGDLTERSFRDYNSTCGRMIDCFGKRRAASNLGPTDFRDYAKIMKGWAPVTRANEIQRVRTIFKYAFESTLIERPMNFGPDFKKPSAKDLAERQAAKPTRLFTHGEITALIHAAGVQMKAMILLAINCGLGNTDVSELNIQHLDLDKAILDFPRPNTSIDRRASLWPETVKALRNVLAYGQSVLTVGENKGKPRYRPADQATVSAVFITHQQRRFVRQNQTANRDSVAMAFGKLLRSKNMKQDGVNFYSLRHTFETIASGAGDQPAVDRIMGHVDSHVRSSYQHWSKDATEDKRLREVADYVHAWLFPKPQKEGA